MHDNDNLKDWLAAALKEIKRWKQADSTVYVVGV